MNATESRRGPVWDLVESLLASDCRIAVAATGGGSRAVSWLFNHPGASRVMLEAQIPYDAAALERFMDRPGPHRAAAETARAMALLAFERVQALLWESAAPSASGPTAVGVGCTAALATDRERRGGDRAHIAVRTPLVYHFVDLCFDKGSGGDRLAQEDVVSVEIVRALAASCCGSDPGLDPMVPAWTERRTDSYPVDGPLEGFLGGDAAVLELDLEGAAVDPQSGERTLLSGSFNPLHPGHEELVAAAHRLTGLDPSLELSIVNVDKAELGYRELIERLHPLRGRYRIAVTRAPTFRDKARVFPHACFVIGYDTASRLLDSRYYGDSAAEMGRALDAIAAAGCRFLVAGRLQDGVFRTLDDLAMPDGIDAGLFEAIPEMAFRHDVSSTEIRGRGTRAQHT